MDKDLPFSQPVTFAHLEWQRCLAESHNKVTKLKPLVSSHRLINVSSLLMLRSWVFLTIRRHHTVPELASGLEVSAQDHLEKRRVAATTLSGVSTHTKRAWRLSTVAMYPSPLSTPSMRSSRWSKRIVRFSTTPHRTTVRSRCRISKVCVIFADMSTDQWEHPRIISLGGDHSIVLPILRSLKTVYGPVSVIHLDSHLDT